MEDLEALRVVGQDRIRSGTSPCRIPVRSVDVDSGYRPAMTVAPFTLHGQYVVLEPLTLDHVDGLLDASTRDRTKLRLDRGTVPDATAMTTYIEALLAQHDARHRRAVRAVPRRRRPVGRLHPLPRAALVRRHRRPDRSGDRAARGCPPTPNGHACNSEAKFLLLQHAFETWRVQRVALCTDARNERSRASIERIGARFEGILRHHRPSAVPAERGRMRDTALFAMTDDDWPEVRAAMATRLGR